MASTSVSATIEKIREEAAVFDSKDRLLSFSQKNKFQSPLLLGNGDQFFESWQTEAKPRALAQFFPVSAKYDEAKQAADLDKFRKVLKSKAEEFCNQDLYMATHPHRKYCTPDTRKKHQVPHCHGFLEKRDFCHPKIL